MVPRHMFVPRYWRLDSFNHPDTLVDPEADPDQHGQWLDAAYRDQSLVTTWSPSTMDGRPVRMVTSSASQPSVVATMLDRLDLQLGHRVLEVGTGTGYNAALLCEYLGSPGSVTSVEIDPCLADSARQRLAWAGHRPRILAADAATTEQLGERYDRIVATCAIKAVPATWIAALKPGGLLVAPGPVGGALMVLSKTGADRLEGRIDPYAVAFMRLRGCPGCQPADGDNFRVGAGRCPRTDTTAVDPAVPHEEHFRFWSAVEEAWTTYRRAGRPSRDQLAVTAGPAGTIVYRAAR